MCKTSCLLLLLPIAVRLVLTVFVVNCHVICSLAPKGTVFVLGSRVVNIGAVYAHACA